MKIKSTEFLRAATDLDGCPPHSLPEFAFIGRSNVGKSSLINLLTQKSDLARVSSTPGRTQSINFYSINQDWCLVDLPGYGYAKTSASKREEFRDFVSNYLNQRQNLLCVFCLIDSRLDPQKIDLQFTHWLMTQEIPFVLVFTKTDKLKPNKVKANTQNFLNAMLEWCDGLPRFFHTSTKEKAGRGEILHFIQDALNAQRQAD